MKRFPRKILSLVLACSLLWTLGISAAASEALGEDLTTKDTLLNERDGAVHQCVLEQRLLRSADGESGDLYAQ